ncbi:1-deoxy-D-xylulose 5-phosphate reductoisomerase [Clostridia bacterium]|nr:1-deoxy-D-xylulose 5-phosphate reductoisomerase [Clostridia bacterium]
MCCHSNYRLLEQQARAFSPELIGLVNPPAGYAVPDDLKHVEWMFGADAANICAAYPSADKTLNAAVGVAGLSPTLSALKAGKDVLLANKESMVAGGSLVTQTAKETGASIIPVDSEHSAIFQCISAAGSFPDRLILTASGGPFLKLTKADIDKATIVQALKHPNWSMGAKVTVDSAGMMNKALEVMEARWLFNTREIDVVVHPQSIIHSMVEFRDGAMLAQLGTPDMRVPIAYAMSHPERVRTGAKRLDLTKYALEFYLVDEARFPMFRLGLDALSSGQGACVAMNAANEAAVGAFIKEKIVFGDIYRIVSDTLDKAEIHSIASIEDVYRLDESARILASSIIGKR